MKNTMLRLKLLLNELGMKRDEVDDEMLNFDGTLAEFYTYLSNKQKIKICQAVTTNY